MGEEKGRDIVSFSLSPATISELKNLVGEENTNASRLVERIINKYILDNTEKRNCKRCFYNKKCKLKFRSDYDTKNCIFKETVSLSNKCVHCKNYIKDTNKCKLIPDEDWYKTNALSSNTHCTFSKFEYDALKEN